MDKEYTINQLEELIEWLKKETVSCETELYAVNGETEGVDPDDWGFRRFHRNGKTNIEIKIGLYDEELDDSNNVFNPNTLTKL